VWGGHGLEVFMFSDTAAELCGSVTCSTSIYVSDATDVIWDDC